MSKIEEIVIKAEKLGFKNLLFDKVSNLKETVKYVEISDLYELALEEILKEKL